MREGHLAGAVNKGAGIYGVPAPTHVTECRHSHNPFGHNKECACGWWGRYLASQIVPYVEDEDDFPESPYGDPWAEADYLHDMQKEREVFGD